jgi:hypothetical protein
MTSTLTSFSRRVGGFAIFSRFMQLGQFCQLNAHALKPPPVPGSECHVSNFYLRVWFYFRVELHYLYLKNEISCGPVHL